MTSLFLSPFCRPFERTIVLQKDSTGHVGFVYKEGKITQIAKDTSAARWGIPQSKTSEYTTLHLNASNMGVIEALGS